jgi:hypothetical protein
VKPGVDDLRGFAAAYDRLRRRALGWVLLGSLTVTVQVGGRRALVAPFGYLLAPLMVASLADLAGRLEGDARRRALAACRAAAIGGLLAYGSWYAVGRASALGADLGLSLTTVATAGAAGALAGWAAKIPGGDGLAADWRRAARWSWAAAGVELAMCAARLGAWALAGRPTDRPVELSGWLALTALPSLILLVLPWWWLLRASAHTRALLHHLVRSRPAGA